MPSPKFDLEGNRFDQSTYFGRITGFTQVINPKCLIISDKKLEKSQELLQKFKEHKENESLIERLPKGVTDDDLWEAKMIKDAVIHPVTGNKIPAPFRMAAFLPANIPIVAGMLNFTSLPATVFWQWANQSYNSALNYANRSGNEVSNSSILTSYGIAVSVSCSIALGIRFFSRKGPKVWQNFASIPFVVPFFSVASAGSTNVYFSRVSEIENGIQVFDIDNNEVGISKIAAKQGVFQTILSRSIGLPIPVLVLPHFMMKLIPKTVTKKPRMLFELAAITISIAIALPITIAIFPQKLELNAKTLENEFHDLKDKNGNTITKLYSNKGL